MKPRLTLRRATAADCLFFFRLRNQSDVRAASLDTAPIPYADHVTWFVRRLAYPHPLTFTAMLGKERIGYARFDLEKDSQQDGPDGTRFIWTRWTISVALRKQFRGKGLGVKLIQAACRRVKGRVTATVREENTASQRAFEAAGFKGVGRGSDPVPHRLYAWQSGGLK